MRRKRNKLEAAQYPKQVAWSEEDQCFIGRCPALFFGGVHGSDEARVYAELCRMAEEWIELEDSDDRRELALAKKRNAGKAGTDWESVKKEFGFDF